MGVPHLAPVAGLYRRVGNYVTSLSPDAHFVAVGDDLGCLHVCELPQGTCAALVAVGPNAGDQACEGSRTPPGLTNGVRFVNNNVLVTSGSDGVLRQWGVTSGPHAPQCSLEEQTRPLTYMRRDSTARGPQRPMFRELGIVVAHQFNGPDGPQLVTACGDRIGDLLLWTPGREPTPLGASNYNAGAMDFVALGGHTYVVAGGETGALDFWRYEVPDDGRGASVSAPYLERRGTYWTEAIHAFGDQGAFTWTSRSEVRFAWPGVSQPVVNLYSFTDGTWIATTPTGAWAGAPTLFDVSERLRWELGSGVEPHRDLGTVRAALAELHPKLIMEP